MALVAGAATFLILGAGLSLWAQLPSVEMSLRELTLKIAHTSASHAASAAIFGAFAGAVTAFFAPASEPQNGLKSAFLRAVFVHALKVWALSCVLMWLSLYFFVLFFYLWINPDWLQIANFILVRALFALSLWHAINRALRAE